MSTVAEENFLLPDDDPALAAHFEFLSDRDDVADSDGGWTSLHMSVAEKRFFELNSYDMI